MNSEDGFKQFFLLLRNIVYVYFIKNANVCDMYLKKQIPGQFLLLQVLESPELPTHCRPPYKGAGLLHDLDRL